ncbi:MAG TPA: hypothetical protein PKY87_01580 [Terricaulis sp.]|nr:hypothetical protein [Terricaulis sp.]
MGDGRIGAAYLSDLAAQVGFLSAFLGGVAGTMLAMFVNAEQRRAVDVWAVAASALSAVAFIVAVIGCTQLLAALHPQAPAAVAAEGQVFARAVAFLAFGLGVYAILLVLGLSGWRHSRGAGWITSAMALVGAGVVSLLLVGG